MQGGAGMFFWNHIPGSLSVREYLIPWWQKAPESMQAADTEDISETLSLRSLCVIMGFFKKLRVYCFLKRGPRGPLLTAVSHPKLPPFQAEQGGLMRYLSGSKSNSIPLPAICLRLPHAYFMISGTFPPYLTSCNASLCCLYYFYLW